MWIHLRNLHSDLSIVPYILQENSLSVMQHTTYLCFKQQAEIS